MSLPKSFLCHLVLISAKEEPEASIPPAMDGLLKIHKRVTDVDADPTHPPAGGTISTRLLVAATQAGNLIGKQGATIKTIQDSSGCVIRVLGQENLPVIALPDDSVVEVQGEREGVHKAVELIASHLRKFLVDRSVIGIFEKQMQMPSGRANQEMAAPQPWAAPPPAQNFPGGGPGYRPAQFMPPQHQFDNYYPPPAMDNQPPRQLPPSYGRDTASMGMHMPPQELMVSKVSQNMQVPLTYADAVIGTSGANISYIRRASGATIAIQESRGNPDEMTVEINGSASQVQTAQQLIHNFMADAAQNPTAGAGAAAAPPLVVATSQAGGGGYNQYPGYPSQPAPPGHPPAGGGDYGSAPMYGGSYGY
ncbi:flowering locus K homology domain isoform X2 [Lactuca sativa]|uniref:flowering locus K homology domain isoform X2 n=1 Tax=Lactuca sativa TaxID=4236 RepID=UPI000CD94548|nr:flowering locus K homology domain isoform X2 [Lactuca sativa]